jgi:hypothetical protein
MAIDEKRGIQPVVWNPPFRDAVDVTIEHILDPKTIAPIEGVVVRFDVIPSYSNEIVYERLL